MNKSMEFSLFKIVHPFVDAVDSILFIFEFFFKLFVVDMIFLAKVQKI